MKLSITLTCTLCVLFTIVVSTPCANASWTPWLPGIAIQPCLFTCLKDMCNEVTVTETACLQQSGRFVPAHTECNCCDYCLLSNGTTTYRAQCNAKILYESISSTSNRIYYSTYTNLSCYKVKKLFPASFKKNPFGCYYIGSPYVNS